MSQKVTKFMGGLGLDVTDVFEVEANSTVTVGGGSGNVVVGTVTVQALDLGTNNPRIRFDDSDTSNNGEITLDNTQLRIEADEDNAVASSAIKLRVDGSDKAAITSSGIDVTGDIQGDGLIIDGTFDLGTL